MKAHLLFGFALFCGLAFAQKYKLDDTHSKMGFKVRHLGISTVSGRFNKYEGSFDYNAKTGKISNLTAQIKAATVDTNVAERDKHLRAQDFFHVDKYPNIKFKATKIKYKNKKPVSMDGKLTLRGVTKNVKLDVDWGGVAEDPWGNQRIAFEASGKIDRRQFGLKWNKGLKKAAGLVVSNDVKLVIEIEGIAQK